MNENPTVDRDLFQKFLASAFVVQQSQMDSQSSSAIAELRRSITNGELAYEAIDLQKVVNANAVVVDAAFGAQLPLLEPEEYRDSVDFVSQLANLLAARDAADASTDTALEAALDDSAEISEIARLIGVCCAVQRSTPPPSEEPHTTADSMNPWFAAARLRPPEVKAARLQSRDPWAPSLGVMAIGLAFLLGWMVGQVTPGVTARSERAPLRVTAGSDTASAKPGVARLAPKFRSSETPTNSSHSQH